jgi:glycosyltransferase involved in cell wall biosynthesis
MKVLVVTGIFPPDHGGPASYVPAIAQALQVHGHEIVSVITLSDDPLHDDRHFGFRVRRIRRGQFRPLRWARTIAMILAAAKNADVVYLNGLVLEGMIASKLLANKPVVIKVVGDLVWEKARNQRATDLDVDTFQSATLPLRWRLLRWLQSRYTGLADAVLTPSRYLASIVRGWGVESSHIHVVYNAVPSPPDARPIFPTHDLVTVARLVPWKGLPVLIRVAAKHGWSLRIVGDGPLREELESLAKRCAANVSFAGHVPHGRVAEEIRGARLFVLNSSYEGLPHIVLEAKACGIPVLASEAGGTPETIAHDVDGWLVPVDDEEALCDGIRRLLTHEDDRARLAHAGQRQVAERFSFAAMVEHTEVILTKVCA